MRAGEIAVVAPFRYSIILWAVLAGYVIWQEIPDLTTVGRHRGNRQQLACLYTFPARAAPCQGRLLMNDNLRGICAVLVILRCLRAQ